MPAVREIVRRAARDDYRMSALVLGVVGERADADEQAPPRDAQRSGLRHAMFVTKKHLSRRTLLRGAGAAIALPLLDSMVPAATALAQTAADA